MLREYAKLIDKEVLYSINRLLIPVKIHDIKVSYGSLRLEISPIGGMGSIWVEKISLVIGEEI